MKTAKGNTFANLISVAVEDKTVSFQMPTALPFTVPGELEQTVIPYITDVIQREKKGSITLEKCLAQIEHHREQLVKAYEKLFSTYHNMTTVQSRTSPIDKARRDMLEVMPDKMLKVFCGAYVDVTEYILPDDREKLICATVTSMREAMQDK